MQFGRPTRYSMSARSYQAIVSMNIGATTVQALGAIVQRDTCSLLVSFSLLEGLTRGTVSAFQKAWKIDCEVTPALIGIVDCCRAVHWLFRRLLVSVGDGIQWDGMPHALAK